MKSTTIGIASAVGMAVVILLAQRLTDSTADTFALGQQAELKRIIGEVIDEKHRLDDGTTYSAALSHLVTDMAVVKEQVDALSED